MADPFARTLGELRRLGGDRRSGAGEIASRTLEPLVRYCRAAERTDPDFHDQLVRLALAVHEVNRAMAPLLLLSNRLLLAAEEPRPVLRNLARDLERRGPDRRGQTAKVATQFARKVSPQSTVLTYSRSSAVVAALSAARKKIGRVILSEGRPAFEGKMLARELTSMGLAVTLTSDAALPSLVREADIVVVGADAVCRRRLVNKTGTEALRVAARKARVPFFVLADSAKFLPPALERWLDPSAGTTRGKPVFEFVPRGPSVTILYGNGKLTGAQMPNSVRRIPVARWWRGRKPEKAKR